MSHPGILARLANTDRLMAEGSIRKRFKGLSSANPDVVRETVTELASFVRKGLATRFLQNVYAGMEIVSDVLDALLNELDRTDSSRGPARSMATWGPEEEDLADSQAEEEYEEDRDYAPPLLVSLLECLRDVVSGGVNGRLLLLCQGVAPVVAILRMYPDSHSVVVAALGALQSGASYSLNQMAQVLKDKEYDEDLKDAYKGNKFGAAPEAPPREVRDPRCRPFVEADVIDLLSLLGAMQGCFRRSLYIMASVYLLLTDLIKMHSEKGKMNFDFESPVWLSNALRPWCPILLARARSLLARFQSVNGKERHELGAQLKVTQQLVVRLVSTDPLTRVLSSGNVGGWALQLLNRTNNDKSVVGKFMGTSALSILKGLALCAESICVTEVGTLSALQDTLMPHVTGRLTLPTGGPSKLFYLSQAVLWGWMYHTQGGALGVEDYASDAPFVAHMARCAAQVKAEEDGEELPKPGKGKGVINKMGAAAKKLDRGHYDLFCGTFVSVPKLLRVRADELQLAAAREKAKPEPAPRSSPPLPTRSTSNSLITPLKVDVVDRGGPMDLTSSPLPTPPVVPIEEDPKMGLRSEERDSPTLPGEDWEASARALMPFCPELWDHGDKRVRHKLAALAAESRTWQAKSIRRHIEEPTLAALDRLHERPAFVTAARRASSATAPPRGTKSKSGKEGKKKKGEKGVETGRRDSLELPKPPAKSKAGVVSPQLPSKRTRRASSSSVGEASPSKARRESVSGVVGASSPAGGTFGFGGKIKGDKKRTPLYPFSAEHALQTMASYRNRYTTAEDAGKQFKRRVVYDRVQLERESGGGKPVQQLVPDAQEDGGHLSFESRFESGNLCRAVQVGPYEYDLMLDHDVNSAGRTQWFYFRLLNLKPRARYTFHIINLEKRSSGFNKGMAPLMYSKGQHEKKGVGWTRARAENISYYPNHWRRIRPVHLGSLIPEAPGADDGDSDEDGPTEADEDGDNGGDETDEKPADNTADSWLHQEQNYFTLTMTLTFPDQPNDTVYLAHFYPYTLTRHLNFMNTLADETQDCLVRQKLCSSLGGNVVELLTITDFNAPPAVIVQRPVVLLTSRVHPGETNASWVFQGLLWWLTSGHAKAVAIRQRCVFKIVPVLNPDGVVAGNYRSNLTGMDLNRFWHQPHPDFHPTIVATKHFISQLTTWRRTSLYCDFHGHSTMADFALYGCSPEGSLIQPRPASPSELRAESTQRYLGVVPPGEAGRERLFPTLLARHGASLFQTSACHYRVERQKLCSARIVMWREFRLWSSYTFEGSFFGSSFGRLKGTFYDTEDMQDMGHCFVLAVGDAVASDADRKAARAAFAKVQAVLAKEKKLPTSTPTPTIIYTEGSRKSTPNSPGRPDFSTSFARPLLLERALSSGSNGGTSAPVFTRMAYFAAHCTSFTLFPALVLPSLEKRGSVKNMKEASGGGQGGIISSSSSNSSGVNRRMSLSNDLSDSASDAEGRSESSGLQNMKIWD